MGLGFGENGCGGFWVIVGVGSALSRFGSSGLC